MSECTHPNPSFDRSICACGLMHYYCDECGAQTDECDEEFAVGKAREGRSVSNDVLSSTNDVLSSLVEERGASYGPPEENHERTALLYNAYLLGRFGVDLGVTREDVCWLAILQKISREMHGGTDDGPRDVQGYARNVEMMRATIDKLDA